MVLNSDLHSLHKTLMAKNAGLVIIVFYTLMIESFINSSPG